MTTHVSFSQLDTYNRCGKRYQLERLLGAPKEPACWLLGGKAFHEFAERINLGQYPIFSGRIARSVPEMVEVLRKDWLEHYDQALAEMVEEFGKPASTWKAGGRKTAEKPNGEDTDWWRINGLLQAAQYANWLATSGWQVFHLGDTAMVEANVTGELGGVEVRAYLDSLLVNPDGELVIVDYKTGTKIPPPVQLGNYRALLMSTVGLTVDSGAFFMSRKAEMTEPFDLRRFTPELVGSLMSDFDRSRSAGIFLPKPGDACHICDVKAACYVVGGALAYRYDPLHPQYAPESEQPTNSEKEKA